MLPARPTRLPAFALAVLLAAAAVAMWAVPAAAQVPPDPAGLVPDPTGSSEILYIHVEPERAFLDMTELSAVNLPITFTDMSFTASEFTQTMTTVDCAQPNVTTPADNWAVTLTPPSPVFRHKSTTTLLSVAAGPRASPERLDIGIVCTANYPEQQGGTTEIANFTITARLRPYYYVQLDKLDAPPRVGPGDEFTYRMRLTNRGSHPSILLGEVTASEGWQAIVPPSIALGPGESTILNVTGIAPRDKLWYQSASGMFTVTYSASESPGRLHVQTIPIQMKGVFLHPALIPLVLIAIAIVVIVLFLAVLARRAIEEQILGKPVPPWRIPIERDFLRELMNTDPDQFYVVRYYLMVEEHESALLWFHAYKRATKKDRKREGAWFKIRRRQERKVRAESKKFERLESRWARKVERVDRQEQRKIRALERKLRRKERKWQRVHDRKVKKRSRKLVKKHRRRVKKAGKKHVRLVARENKKVANANRRREKRGEELLPPPSIPEPVIEPPAEPERTVFEAKPLDDSRYGKRAARIRAGFARRKARKEARRDRVLARKDEATQRRIAKLRAKIPPEPKTHLYEKDEYMAPEEVIVEDDRGLFARLLHLPTLEEREEGRRRNAVYDAKIRAAGREGDTSRVATLREAKAAERRSRLEDRRESVRAEKATRREEALLAKEHARQVRKRANDLLEENRQAGKALSGGPTPEATPPEPAASKAGGFRARLGKKKDAPEEEAKKGALQSRKE